MLSYLIHALMTVLAVCGVLPAAIYTSPWRVNGQFVPVLTVAAGIACWYMPTGLDTGLAAAPMALYLIDKVIRLNVTDVPAADWSPAKATTAKAGTHAKNSAGKAKAKLATAKLPWRKPGTPPEPVEVTEYVKGDEDFVQGDDTASPATDEAGDTPQDKPALAEKFDWRARLKEIHSPENAHKFGTREAF
jgi:hypothetical protein